MAEENSKLLTDREALEQGTAILFAALVEGAKTSTAVAASVGMGAALTVFSPIFALLFARGALHLFGRRATFFDQGYVRAHGGDPAQARTHAEENAEDATYHETMFRAFRQMADAADDSVVETLGYMAGQYTYAKRKPDRFFRGLGRLLCDLEAEELGELIALLRAIEAANQEYNDSWIDVVIDLDALPHDQQPPPVPGDTPGSFSQEILDEEVVKIVISRSSAVEVGRYSSAGRLFGMLKREGLAENKSLVDEDKRGYPGGDQAMFISAEMLSRILAMLDMRPAAQI